MDDPRASQQLATLMRDADPQVAQMAISSSYNGGPEVDTTLTQIVNDPSATAELKAAAAGQLRNRGTDLDDATEQMVTKLAGAATATAATATAAYSRRGDEWLRPDVARRPCDASGR